MIFKKINLHNFRQYKGDIEIKFSTDSQKNVTVLIGDNTSGKTTLMQAFNWCLYNQINLENPNEIITNEVISKIDIGENAKAEVILEFEHLSKTYTCKNYIVYTRNNNGNIQKIDEAQIYTVSDPATGETKRTTDNAIKEVFPRDLSSYFLFDGERMQTLVDNQKKGKKDLSNAVKNLLGLDVLENATNHLEKAKKEFATELRADSEKQTKLEEVNKKIEELEQTIENDKKLIVLLDDEIIKSEEEQTKVSEIIKSYAALKELQNKRIDLQNRIERQKSNIEKKKTDIFRTFGTAGTNFFIGKTFDKLTEKIKNTKLSDKSIDGINANAIDQILQRKRCVCGCDLTKDINAVETLRDLKKYLPPESYSVLLKGLEVRIKNTRENNEKYYDNFLSMYKEYNELLAQYDLLKDDLDTTEKKIATVGDKDITSYDEKYKELRELISKKTLALGSAKGQVEANTNRLAQQEDLRSQYIASNNINDQIMLKIDVCEDLITKVSKRLNEKESEVKARLQEKTTDLLSRMLNSGKKITIGDDYNFTVTDEFNTTANSEGEKVVISFAFVGSIISIAKDFLKKTNGTDVDKMDDDKFTLVMDAPFAKLDEKHSKNVTGIIPNLTDQIILFTVDKQWNGTVRDTLTPRVGLMYKIEKEGSSSHIVKMKMEDE